MTTDAILMIAVNDIKPACANEPDVILRLQKAMKKARDFWMSTDENLQLRAACAAAMMTGSEEDKDRIGRSYKLLATLSALISGVPVDVEAATTAAGDDLIPIMKMWHESARK